MTLHADAQRARATSLRWRPLGHEIDFAWADEAAVSVSAIDGLPLHRVPFAQIVTATRGHVPASDRLVGSSIGQALRLVSHSLDDDALEFVQSDGAVTVSTRLERRGRAIRTTTAVRNDSGSSVVLRSAASAAVGLPLGQGDDRLRGWDLVSARSDWLGEGRWQRRSLRESGLVPLSSDLTGHDPRSAHIVTSDGTWSTSAHLPVAVLENVDTGLAIAWQIEHNGAWRWEVGEDIGGGYLALSGPTDKDSSWTHVLAPGAEFRTVPTSLAIGGSVTDAVQALTDHRRALRRPHPDNSAMPVVFNDYMNTLDGDPTTERLLPLIAAAGEAGAEVFCIDAGWYDDSGHWWDTVGEWRPSHTRFPGGFSEVIESIRAHGMVPGLWLEPEVIGVRSPIADALPDEAFLQRHGARIVEHHRYHLDLRSDAAIAHLDSVVDRLVAEFGIGFFKFDYNIDPGPGTDLGSDSVGDGLLAHNRAHLDWLDRLLVRHPNLIIENCSSGAMRMDFAMMSRLAMQSTSDQQDFLKYPPIAAAAPMSLLPEQAASWAYPQPEMNDEESAFCLVTGLLGRFYVSGHLNRMTEVQRERVAEAIAIAKSLRHDISSALPYWPAGLPTWSGDWTALGLTSAASDLVSLWRRGASGSRDFSLPHLAGTDVVVETVFPKDLPEWATEWNADSGILTVHAQGSGPAARTLRITRRTAQPTAAHDSTRIHHHEGAIQ